MKRERLSVNMRTALHTLALAMLGTVATLPAAQAQPVMLDPGAAVEAVPDARSPQNVPSDEAAIAAAAAAGAASAAPGPQTSPQPVTPSFVLRDVRFSNRSEFLTDGELAAATARLVGRRYLQRDARVIAASIGQAYADKNILTGTVELRAADFNRGVLTVELVESRIGTVTAPDGPISTAYLQYRLGLYPGTLADNRAVNSALARLFATDGLLVQAQFSGGRQSDVQLALPDLPPRITLITLDTYGSPSQGRLQLTVAHTITSLTGFNDPLSFVLVGRQGSRVGTLSYSRVVSPGGVRLGLSISATESRTVTVPVFTSAVRNASLSLTAPVRTTDRSDLFFSAALTAFSENSSFLGARTLDQNGYELSLGLRGVVRGEKSTFNAALSLLIGQYDDAIAARTNIGYGALSLSGTYSRTLGEYIFGSISFGAQKSLGGTMPSQRLFTVTAPGAVRGYPTSLSSGDSGYYARFQIEKSTPYQVNATTGLRPFGFVDLGEAFDSTGTGLGLASSIGLGASFTSGANLFGDIYIARPLTTKITGWANPSRKVQIGASISVRF